MKKYISYIYVILSAVCWGFIGFSNRLLTEAGASLGNRVFIRNFGTLLVLTVWTFMVFDIIFGMTGGGPVNATKTLPMRIYQEMFGMKNLGTASAWSLIAIGVLVIVTILYWNMDKEDKS